MKRFFSNIAAAFVVACVWLSAPVIASAQIGPELRPPGLPANHPINAYSIQTQKETATDWRHQTSWELNAGDVVFSAAKKRQLISEAPSTIHVITDREIASHGWRTIAEILRHVPGVQTQTTQSQFQSVMIRGLVGTENNNSRILWLQNGIPMNDVRDSGIWLDETYPVELIKRIEVVLGPGSALYGSGAFQGVINIFTKDPDDINKYGEYRIAIQNNLTFKSSAIAAHTFDNGLGILGHVSANTTQGPGLIGDYVYTNYLMDQAGKSISQGNPANNFRYSSVDGNSDKHWYTINLKLNYKSFKWNAGFTDIYAGADGSEIVPGVAYIQPSSILSDQTQDQPGIVYSNAKAGDNYRFNRREFYTDLIYEDSISDNFSILALLSYRLNQYRHEHYSGYTDDSNLSDIDSCVSQDGSMQCNSAYTGKINYTTLQHKLYALGQFQWRIIESNELIGGLVMEYHHIHSPDFIHGYNPVSSTFLNAQTIGYLTPSIFIQDEQRFWRNQIILTAGLRFDAYKATYDLDPAASWRFAFLAKWTEWMTMRLSYGHAFKQPSLYQLYVDTFDYLGDPNLKPEQLENAELAFLFTPTYFMKIRLDSFFTYMTNLIVMRFDNNLHEKFSGISGKFTAKQDSDAYLGGFEISLDTSIGESWNLYSHYNFLYSRFKHDKNSSSKDDQIPDDAMHRIKLGATYSNKLLTADLAMFVVAGSPKTQSAFAWKDKNQISAYAILQPQLTLSLPADIALTFQASYAFSDYSVESPAYRYYYEKEGVPVNRYTLLLSLQYPYYNK